MLTAMGNSPRSPALRVVTDGDVAALLAERDRQLKDIAGRLEARPELGIRREVVCGLRDTYDIERSAGAFASTQDAEPARVGHKVTELLRRIAIRGRRPGDR